MGESGGAVDGDALGGDDGEAAEHGGRVGFVDPVYLDPGVGGEHDLLTHCEGFDETVEVFVGAGRHDVRH